MLGLQRTKSEVARINNDITALIDHQYALVKDGKNAKKLAQLFYEYEMNSFTDNISKDAQFLEKYALALLLNCDFLKLHFFLLRYKNTIKSADLLARVAQLGKEEHLEQLWKAIQQFFKATPGTDSVVKQRIREIVIEFYLKTLAKYFKNIELSALENWMKATSAQIENCGLKVKSGIVFLRQQQAIPDCLQTKLKQLIFVTNKMSHLE